MAILNQKLSFSSLLKNLFSIFIILFSVSSHAEDTRIVSLNPAITEVLYQLGLENKIVGVSSFSDYPDSAKKIPSVGSYLKPSIERIVRLKPTHVLVFKEGDPSIETELKNAKLNYIVFESRSLEDFENLIQKLSTMFHVEKKASELMDMWKHQWGLLKNLPKEKKKIMIEVDHNPVFIAGGDTFISKAFEKCGYQNIFEKIDGYKKIQTEAVIKKKPDVIIVLGQLNKLTDFQSVAEFWKKNKALKKVRIIKGDADELSRLSFRLPDAITKYCREISRQ